MGFCNFEFEVFYAVIMKDSAPYICVKSHSLRWRFIRGRLRQYISKLPRRRCEYVRLLISKLVAPLRHKFFCKSNERIEYSYIGLADFFCFLFQEKVLSLKVCSRSNWIFRGFKN